LKSCAKQGNSQEKDPEGTTGSPRENKASFYDLKKFLRKNSDKKGKEKHRRRKIKGSYTDIGFIFRPTEAKK